MDQLAFILVCYYCENCIEQGTSDDARKQGWIRIRFDDGIGWTMLGFCPDCQLEFAEEDNKAVKQTVQLELFA